LRRLVGDTVRAIQTPPRWCERAERLLGARLTGVVTHGKHLVLEFSNDWVIHTHAMQYGSWQVGSRREPLRKDARFIRLRIDTPGRRAVFFHGPVMEVLSREEVTRHERFNSLGPDVLSPDFDADAVHAAMVTQGDREIGEVVLDQRVVSGIGNIYKSEGLFLAAIDPRRTASGVTFDDTTAFFAEVIPLMQAGRQRSG
jgi:endonuclease-8